MRKEVHTENFKDLDFPYSSRKYSHVLGAFNNNSVGLRVVGVDVEREADVTKLDEHLKEGKWLSGEYAEVVIGYKLQKTYS